MTVLARVLLCLSLALLSSCLEQEEEIVVHPDGSVTLTVSARGHDHDLTEGYAVPLHGPFVPQNDETRRWMRTVGEDTGSLATRERFETHGWAATDPDRTTIVSRADFASVDELPAGYAPRDEPYASAYLQRDARLSIEEKGGKRVYTFERTFVGRTHAGWQLWDAEIEQIGQESLDDFANWDHAEFTRVSKIMTAGLLRHGEALVRSSLLSIYTEGEATLDTSGFERVVAETTAACSRILTSGARSPTRCSFGSARSRRTRCWRRGPPSRSATGSQLETPRRSTCPTRRPRTRCRPAPRPTGYGSGAET